MKMLTPPYTDALPPLVATIGCFDGVHRGHRFLIEQVCAEAARRQLASALITFPVHPRQVMQSGYCPQLLSCLSQKTELLLCQPADYCLLFPFTQELSLLSARDFMRQLHDRFHIQVLVIGYDHRFGHNRREGFEDYCRYGDELGMEVVQAAPLRMDGVSVSSSLIRDLLRKGDVQRANRFLGYPYYLNGQVVSGHQIGRTLGFPTANLQPLCAEKLIPAHGAYAVYVYLGDTRYRGIMNIGHRPTLDNGPQTSIEVHILDFAGDIYHHSLKVELMAYLRPEQRFPSTEALVEQLEKDRLQAIGLLEKTSR